MPAARNLVAELQGDGWTLRDPLPTEPWGLMGRGVLHLGFPESADALEAALVAAARGAGVVLVAPRDDRTLARLVDDLSRLGHVQLLDEHDVSDAPLTADQQHLLDLLAHGVSVSEAARRLNLSRRTAHRRLDEAKRALGARCTAEAVARSRVGEIRVDRSLPARSATPR